MPDDGPRGLVPPPELATEVCDAYRLGTGAHVDGPAEEGRLGLVWPLRTSTGRYAVKVPFAPPGEEPVRADADYQDAVRAVGVPAPAVVRDPDGQVLRQLADGSVVRVYEWVEVGPADRGLDPAAVGRAVAAIHRVEHPADGPVPAWHTAAVGMTGWLDLADRASAAGAPFASDLHRLVPELVALEDLLEAPGAVRRCHRDLWADNVRSSAGGGVMVLDWENSGPADPAGELPMVMFEFGQGDAGRMSELYAAYVDAGGPARVTAPGDCTMLVATLGHILQEGVRRWLAGTTPGSRERDAAWVAEGLDDPLSRQVVDGIVGAATRVTGRSG